MEEFNHLSVPISIVLGLAMSELLIRVGRIIQCRKHVRFYWLPMAWVAVLLVTIVQSWWAVFGLRNMHDWNFFGFLIVLLHPLALFLAVALVLPDRDEFLKGSVDLKAHYFDQYRWFFAAVLVAISASLARPLVLTGSVDLSLDAYIQVFLFALALVAIVVPAKWYHSLLVFVFAATISTYITLLFLRL